ncbi:MAG: hypothetical protein LBD03_08775 [Methanobrevibacter sp.]|jgi:hypothetical protein|nr:hypothetical protein [Candidatus Methanovirga procula]
MNTAIKTLLMKELNSSVKSKKYLLSLVLNLIIIVLLSFGLSNINQSNSLNISILELLFIILPLFNILISNISILNEIFVNEKLVKTLEAMLTTPLTLFEIAISKLITIAVLTYLMAITSILTLYLTLGLRLGSFISFPTEVWVTIFIVPLIGILYSAFLSYIILRLNYTRLTEILNISIIFSFIFLFRDPSKLLDILSSGNIVSYHTIIIVFIIIMIFYSAILLLIKKINIEHIIVPKL